MNLILNDANILIQVDDFHSAKLPYNAVYGLEILPETADLYRNLDISLLWGAKIQAE